MLQGLDVVFQIQGTFQPRNYCVQYRETDFNFASRLMEEEGIFYFFTHSDAGHKMVLANTAQSHPDMPLGNKLLFEKNLTSQLLEDRILTWERLQEVASGQHTLWDHSFEMPGKNLEAKKKVQETVQAGKLTHQIKAGQADSREVYDFPGDYAVRFDGVNAGGGDQAADVQKIFTDNERTVGIRSQQEAVLGVINHGTGTYRNLVSGHKFTLDRHANANGDYLLVNVRHQISGRIDYRSADSRGFQYINSFAAIPFAMPYRPQRVTPRPFVQGTQTAVVVGPAGQEIFTDKYGRVKVQFFWDREGKKDAGSSCWVRVGQLWAGKRWGASFWPRIGQEVIVAFLEGNPDAPIIVGSVYNAEQMPPYLGDGLDSKHPKNNKLTGVKSCTTPGGQGFNEWRFDDTKGKEQFFIHAQNSMDTRVGGSSMISVGGNHHIVVGGVDKNGNKSGDWNQMVYQDVHIHVLRNRIEKIEGDLIMAVGFGQADSGGNFIMVVQKDMTEMVKGAKAEIVKGNQVEWVQGSKYVKVVGDSYAKAGNRYAIHAGDEIHIKGAKIVIEADSQLSLKVGGNFVDIGPAGVTVYGTQVVINSGGSPASGSGAEEKTVDEPTPAEPAAATAADSSKSGHPSAPS